MSDIAPGDWASSAGRTAFLQSLARDGIVSKACDAGGLTQRAADLLRREDKEFDTDWQYSVERSVDALELAVRQRVIEGTPSFNMTAGAGGTQPITGRALCQRGFKESLARILLKANRPEKFGNTMRVDVGRPIEEMANDPDPPVLDRGAAD